MVSAVTDPHLINQLEGGPQPVTDPMLLKSLEAAPGPPPVVAPGTSRANFMDALSSMGTAGGLPEQVGFPDATQQAGTSLAYSTAMGLRDPLDAAAQLAARGGAALPAGPVQKFFQGQVQDVEGARKAAEASYQANSAMSGGSFDPARALGNVLATAPIAYAMPGAGATKFLPQMLSGTASGAALSALQPVSDAQSPDFWKEKGGQVAMGAASGGASSAALNLLARAISPATSEAAQKMLDVGVTPTPGQIMGGTANRVEEKLQSIPVIGDAITNAKARGMEQFNRATVNQALAPIGEQLDMKTPLGREAIDEMSSKISGAYDTILPKATVKLDPQFASDVGNVVGMVRSGLNPQQSDQFSNILQGKLLNKFSDAGVMSGDGWKQAESELGRLASGYRSSPDFDQRQLGDALSEVQSNLRGLLQRSNPDLAPQIQAANQAWALSRRVSIAAAKPNAEPGMFSPAQLVQAVRQADPTRNKTAFARGNALMQDYAEAAKQVLGSRVPDSGTAGRAALFGIPTALAGLAYSGHPGAAIGAGLAGTAALGAYSPVGQRTLAALLASRPAVAPAIAQGARNLTPLGTASLLSLMGQSGGTP